MLAIHFVKQNSMMVISIASILPVSYYERMTCMVMVSVKCQEEVTRGAGEEGVVTSAGGNRDSSWL